MTFRCRVNAEQFRNLISMPTALIEETDITLGTTGIRIQTMDPAHVAMVRMELSKSMFEDYVCDKDMKVRLCINSSGKYGNGSSLIGQFPNKSKIETVNVALDEDMKKLFGGVRRNLTRRRSSGLLVSTETIFIRLQPPPKTTNSLLESSKNFSWS